ncbi:MAG: T9SS type A sorting domain-containing protein [Bacteroidales bacterium]
MLPPTDSLMPDPENKVQIEILSPLSDSAIQTENINYILGLKDSLNSETIIHLTNLHSGKYKLKVQLYYEKEPFHILDTISSNIEVKLKQLPPPTLDPPAGTYNQPISICFHTPIKEAQIYYSLEGKEPNIPYPSGSFIYIPKSTLLNYKLIATNFDPYIGKILYIIEPTAINARNLLQASIYPNPCKGEFFIDVNFPSTLEIFSISGVLIQKRTIDKKSIISIPNRGIYFIRLSNLQKGIFTQKIIIE